MQSRGFQKWFSKHGREHSVLPFAVLPSRTVFSSGAAVFQYKRKMLGLTGAGWCDVMLSEVGFGILSFPAQLILEGGQSSHASAHALCRSPYQSFKGFSSRFAHASLTSCTSLSVYSAVILMAVI